tara:strand:- start:1260 stop:1841 length:582 start_codon:yes stop_codon:yes gene_type:complete
MINSEINSGYLELILGCMFSGKTSALIEIYKQNILCKKKCLVINYSGDTRYSSSRLTTHDKCEIPCVFTENLLELENNNNDEYRPDNNEIILINEGQFFPDLIPFVNKYLNERHKTIYICGLDGDYKREKFGNLLDLIPKADNYRKLKALCINCKNGTRAAFTFRLCNETKQTLIGSDEYIPVCRDCYCRLTK